MPREQQSEAARATTGRSVLHGGLWYVGSFALPQIYTLVISIVAARFLGPDGMGRQSYIAFVSLTLTTIFSSSLYTAMMRFIGESAGRGREELLPGLLWWAWRVEAVAAAVAGATLGLVAVFGGEPHGAWAFAAVVSVAGILHTVPTAVLIGLQRFRQASIVGLATGAVSTIAVALVLWQGGGITGMFAVEAVTGVANLLWTGWLARRALRVSPTSAEIVDDQGLADLRRRVGRFALLSSIGLFMELIVGTRSEFFFLGHYSTDAEIAFYSIAYSTVAAVRLIPRALAASTAPAFATLFGAGRHDRIRSGYSRSLRLLVIATLPLTAGGLSLGPELITAVYGQAYTGAGAPVQILFAAFPVIAVSSLANSLLTGLGKIRIPLVANALGAGADVALAFLLVPLLDARGAAVANAVGQGTYALVVLVAAARLVGPLEWRLGALARNVLASVAAFGAGWATVHAVDGFGGVALGSIALALAYIAVALVVRLLPKDDAAWLAEAFGNRPIVRLVCERCSIR